MSTSTPSTATSSTSAGRGHPPHRRPNRGKALRARGRRALRGADFRTFAGRDGGEEGEGEEEDEEERKEREAWEAKWRGRELVSNAGRYEEVDPAEEGAAAGGLEGEDEGKKEEEEGWREILRAKQVERTRPSAHTEAAPQNSDEDGVDESLSHLPSAQPAGEGKKPPRAVLEWDEELERLRQEKEQADALRDLKARFRGDAQRRGALPTSASSGKSMRGAGREVGKKKAPYALQDEEKPDESFLDDLLG